MGRSPSPTAARRREDPKRDRDRAERSRRERHRSRERERSRSRDNNPRSVRTRQRSTDRRVNRRSRSRSDSPTAGGSTKPSQVSRSNAQAERPAITQADLEGKSPEEQEMIRVMGFGGFQTTKGKKVENNEAGEVQVVLKRKYRQYMNRKGGFNRPLDFVA